MKRGLITVVALLAIVSLASADYIMIKIDLNQVNQKLEIPGLGAPGTGSGPGGGEGGFGPGGAGPGAGSGAGLGGGGLQGGGRGGPPPGPGEGGAAAGTAQATLTPLWVHACLELKSKPKMLPAPWNFVGVIETKLGKSTYVPGQLVSFISKDDTLIRRFESRKADVIRKKKDADRMIELATWALNHGLFKQFHETMEDFKQTHPKHAVGMAYTKTKADLAKKPTEDDPAVRTVMADLRSSGYKTFPSDQGHYNVMSNLLVPMNEPLIKRYRARLEETFEGFFYWFALNDASKSVQVPQRRLLVVLDADPKKFLEKHVLWGNLPMMSDGFTPRRENVIFLSSRRTDEAYTTLEKNNFTHMQSLKLSEAELLDGTVWKVRTDLTSNATPLMVLQTMVLIQKAMEEEGERTSVSHEGTRQLLAATGLLPKNVEAPEWIQAGMASFFDTPYRAFYTSMASPSWTHLVNFKHYQKNKTLDPKKSAEVLGNVISDRYFRRARQSSAIADLNKEDNSKLAEKAKEDWEIARATAWSFTYYLARNNKLHYLKRYFDEVSNLPRDLEFDDGALTSCFARAFELADAKNDTQLDASKLAALAADWFSQIDNVSLEIVESEHEGLRSREPPPPPKQAMPAPGS